MYKITKEEAEKIYNIWCSSEDSKFQLDWQEYDLDYDCDNDVCYTDSEGELIKLTGVFKDDVSVQIVEWVYTEMDNWRD